ncbi:MAG: hypothetical protein ABI175_17525, partial [Polyangiales bacterium]
MRIVCAACLAWLLLGCGGRVDAVAVDGGHDVDPASSMSDTGSSSSSDAASKGDVGTDTSPALPVL